MTPTDFIGFIGISILLIAYFLHLTNYINKDSFSYLFMNFIGAGTACYASVLLDYLPFVILEASWTLVSAIGLFTFFKKAGKRA
ncbi:MAG: hypothetical protein WKF89_01985 [Chitinophagaceae bacterium]